MCVFYSKTRIEMEHTHNHERVERPVFCKISSSLRKFRSSARHRFRFRRGSCRKDTLAGDATLQKKVQRKKCKTKTKDRQKHKRVTLEGRVRVTLE